QAKDKIFNYNFYNSCNCLVEADCQPPFSINKEALVIVGVISKLTNSSFVDRSYIMRKQVIDGSNVSGFQRTTMISTDGYLNLENNKKINVNKILLEEDAARNLDKEAVSKSYILDRLGTPLIELVTDPDITSPTEAKETALNIGQLFRLTGKVKRGLGSIRQDINVSIANGARVEIKGTQQLDLIPEIVKREVIRQLNLLEVKEELKKRQIKKFNLEEKDITEIFKTSDSKIIKEAITCSKQIYIFKLEKLKGILGFQVQPNRRVGSELSSILKVRTSLKGLFHLDELPNYGITNNDLETIKNKLNLKEEDSFIMIACKRAEINLVKEILESRLNQLLIGIPKETRVVDIEGNTQYQRPLSTESRMYPETDLFYIEYNKNYLLEISKSIPLSLEKRYELYTTKFNLSKQLAEKMKLDNYAPFFEKKVSEKKINPTTLAVFLLEDLTKIIREKLIREEDITLSKLEEFFSSDFENISKQKLVEAFIYFINNNCSAIDALAILNLNSNNNLDIDKIIDETFNENKEKILELKNRSIGLLMGRVMDKTKGQIDGKIISKTLNIKLEEFLKNKCI
ncbi:MAG: Glu-tRNA(Gln) amidotransferase subunit GatE, partial [archaeon]